MALQINNPKYGNVFVVADTFEELRSVASTKIQDGYSAIVAGDTAPADGFGGLLVWNTISTVPDNGETVIAPADGQSGRWLKIAVGRTGPQGQSITGPQGVPGPSGPSGPAGSGANAKLVTNGPGLSVIVGAFTLTGPDGAKITYAGGTVPVFASGTFHLGYDLFDGVVRALRYRLGDGCLWLGTVTTNATTIVGDIIQESALALPPCRIPVFQAKRQRSLATLRIAIIGTSLVNGAGSGTFWYQLLTDSAFANQGLGLNGTIQLANIAQGGSTAHHSIMQLGESTYSVGGGFGGTEISLGPVYQALNGVPKAATKRSPWLSYDVLLIGPQANGGTFNDTYMENCIRRARKAGMEVIILTENNRTDNRDGFINPGFPLLQRWADAYGCAIADTWSYMRWTEDMGINAHDDVIHQNAAGHLSWARAIRSTINDRKLTAMPQTIPERRVSLPSEVSAQQKFPSIAQVQFVPYETNGVTEGISAAFYDAQNAPTLAFGGRTLSQNHYKLTAGQYAMYGSSYASAMDIIISTTENCVVDVYTQNRNTLLTTLTVPGNGTANNVVVEGLQFGTFADISAGQPGFNNRGVQLVCKSGTARIVGVVFHTPEVTEISPMQMQFFGTWNTEAWIYGINYSRYTDTLNDSVIIPFTGTTAQVLLGVRDAGGKVDVYLDNERIYTDVDLAGNAFVNAITVSAKAAAPTGVTSNDFATGHGNHVIKIVLKTLSVKTPTASSRNLSIVAAYAFDMR